MASLLISILGLLATASVTDALVMPRSFNLRTLPRTFGLQAVPKGWVGGFAESNPAYAYPRLTPDLSDLPILDNMANIDKLTRQQKVPYPEFSWLSVPGDDESRVYQMFAPDISRIGYDDKGRVYSIICPQQGFGSAVLGTLNVEVTVTGQRGWVIEPGHTVYADMGVKGRIWISPGEKTPQIVKALEEKYAGKNFPFSKEHSINITTHNPGQPWNPVFSLFNGTDPSFQQPLISQHWKSSYGVGYLNVEIGGIEKTGDKNVDRFNQMILDVFNLGSGNILKKGSTLSWNVWFAEPQLVNRTEWAEHAEKWRRSIDVNHTSPTGDGSTQKYYDGRIFKPLRSAFFEEMKLVTSFLTTGTLPQVSRGFSADEEEDEEETEVGSFLSDIDFDRYDDSD